MYIYETEKPKIFREDGSILYTKIRDHVRGLLHTAGAFDMMHGASGNSGDSWTMMACIDRMVEIGELKEIPTNGRGQDRLFVRGDK